MIDAILFQFVYKFWVRDGIEGTTHDFGNYSPLTDSYKSFRDSKRFVSVERIDKIHVVQSDVVTEFD